MYAGFIYTKRKILPEKTGRKYKIWWAIRNSNP